MKNDKLLTVITSIIILLPIIAGLVFWNELPDTIATHFGMNNEPDGWSSKTMVVFGMPLILCALHNLCLFMKRNDPKKQNVGEKISGIVYWIIPLIALLVMALTYTYALGRATDVGYFANLILGALMIVLGNYMPKARRNFTFGIKNPWTLSGEEIWNKTHRLAAWVWVAGGLVFIVNSFFKATWVIIPLVVLMVLIPTVYSYALYKKQPKQDDE